MYHDRIDLTISAIATAPGSSIGIIRISGNKSFEIARILTGKKSSFNHLQGELVKISDAENSTIERCILLPFKAPRSFTGENVVELHVHGASENASQIFQNIVNLGASPALSGEFSFRAVLNGKMSLNESLSLNALVTAGNPLSVKLSRIASFEDELTLKLRSLIKAWENYHVITTALVDFPDQINDEIDPGAIIDDGKTLKELLESIVKNTLKYRKALQFSILIAGKPNVGKSTLFNTLLKNNRAITSPTEGTTRDYISETLFIEGFPVKLIDSAGIRETLSTIETEGVEKSRTLFKTSDLMLVVLDGSSSLTGKDRAIINETQDNHRVLVYNKSDISTEKLSFDDGISISCKTGEGIEQLISAIKKEISKILPDTGVSLFFSDWQVSTARRIIKNIDSLHDLFLNDQIELIATIIKSIFYDIRNLTGEISAFDIYDEIFGTFCLGK